MSDRFYIIIPDNSLSNYKLQKKNLEFATPLEQLPYKNLDTIVTTEYPQQWLELATKISHALTSIIYLDKIPKIYVCKLAMLKVWRNFHLYTSNYPIVCC